MIRRLAWMISIQSQGGNLGIAGYETTSVTWKSLLIVQLCEHVCRKERDHNLSPEIIDRGEFIFPAGWDRINLQLRVSGEHVTKTTADRKWKYCMNLHSLQPEQLN